MRGFKKSKKSGTCSIQNEIVMPYLLKSCNRDQSPLRASKCYYDKCYKVKSIISKSEKTSIWGNVVEVEVKHLGKKESLIVKWSRYTNDKYNMLREIKFQNISYSLGLSPKIKLYYEDSNYVYIFMDNLLKQGYNTIGKLYKKEKPSKNNYFNPIEPRVLQDIALAIDKLYNYGICHLDLHAYNIFYNPVKHSVKFIDFGFAKLYPTKEQAILNDDITLQRAEEGMRNKLIPKEWKYISEYLKKINGL